MLYFAYGFGASIFLAFPLVGVAILKRSFKAGFKVYED